jgi:hypothetical protein
MFALATTHIGIGVKRLLDGFFDANLSSLTYFTSQCLSHLPLMLRMINPWLRQIYRAPSTLLQT